MAQQVSKPNPGGFPKARDILANEDLVASVKGSEEKLFGLFGDTGVLLLEITKNPSKLEELERKVESGLIDKSDVDKMAAVMVEVEELTTGLQIRFDEAFRNNGLEIARLEQELAHAKQRSAQLRHDQQLREARDAEAMASDDEEY